jgi:hypothetical protein
MQPLAGFQIELVDCARDRGRRRRTQRLLHGPQRFFAVRRLDQDQAGRIETEILQAVTVQAAMRAAVLAQPKDRHHQEQWLRAWQAGENRRDETEGGG